MTPEVRTIVIRLVDPDGEISVKAGIFGPLAVHVSPSGSGAYHVTHVAMQSVIAKDLTRERAIALATRLMADRYWDFRNKEEFEERKEVLFPRLVAAMKEIGA